MKICGCYSKCACQWWFPKQILKLFGTDSSVNKLWKWVDRKKKKIERIFNEGKEILIITFLLLMCVTSTFLLVGRMKVESMKKFFFLLLWLNQKLMFLNWNDYSFFLTHSLSSMRACVPLNFLHSFVLWSFFFAFLLVLLSSINNSSTDQHNTFFELAFVYCDNYTP